MGKIKEGKLIYHLTSIDNLDSILSNGLLARSKIKIFDDVADKEIISLRKDKNLDKYIPFHFFSKNPFDGIVQKFHSDKIFIYITLKREYAEKNKFKILTQHPASLDPLILHDYSKGINLINWEIMEERDYSDQNCKNICMAECLSPNSIRAKDFFCIYVKNRKTQFTVEQSCGRILRRYNFLISINDGMFVS